MVLILKNNLFLGFADLSLSFSVWPHVLDFDSVSHSRTASLHAFRSAWWRNGVGFFLCFPNYLLIFSSGYMLLNAEMLSLILCLYFWVNVETRSGYAWIWFLFSFLILFVIVIKQWILCLDERYAHSDIAFSWIFLWDLRGSEYFSPITSCQYPKLDYEFEEAIPFLLFLWFGIFSSIYMKINKALLISS